MLKSQTVIVLLWLALSQGRSSVWKKVQGQSNQEVANAVAGGPEHSVLITLALSHSPLDSGDSWYWHLWSE